MSQTKISELKAKFIKLDWSHCAYANWFRIQTASKRRIDITIGMNSVLMDDRNSHRSRAVR